MWPVLIEQFNCRFLSNDAEGEVQLITSFLHFYWAIMGVLEFIRNTALRTILDLVNVASID